MIASGAELALDHSDASLLGQLIQVFEAKRNRNMVRSVYYDGKAALKDFGISLPPKMRGIEAALGWVGKGVHALTDRSQFEGFVSAEDSDDPFNLSEILWDNRFKVEFPAATVSSAVHGCSFLTVSQGDVQSGEPAVLVLPRAADSSAAIWDSRRRSLRGFLSVVDMDGPQVTKMVMYTPEKVVSLSRGERSWRADVRRNPLGVVSVAPLVHKFELGRPLGHSRITRAAMGYADSALRTIVRAEVSAEFYSAPEYWLFGTDVSDFIGDDKWSAIMGRIKALDVEPGPDEKPDLHRFTGASPQPHTDQLRMWANLFADDQDLDVKFADSSNPSSADAIFAAKESLITTTKDANASWGFGAVQAMHLAVMLRDGLSTVPIELRSLSAQFTPPEIVSPSARADAFSKLATAMPGFGESEVGMEFAGLSREQVIRLQAERDGDITSPIDAADLRQKFDALGVAIRAGVEPMSAARALGLTGA